MDKIDAFVRSPVRPLVTLLFAVGFVYLAAIGKIPPDTFVVTATAVILWWFRSRDDHENGTPPPDRAIPRR